MSYFSRHMDPEDIVPKMTVEIWKERDNGKKYPIITFFEEMDTEKIIEKAEEYLNKKYPEWRFQKDKFSLKVIPPEEEE